jgi:hypothetical protein
VSGGGSGDGSRTRWYALKATLLNGQQDNIGRVFNRNTGFSTEKGSYFVARSAKLPYDNEFWR